MELALRPKVPMYCWTGVPYVVALGVCDACEDLAILWPYGLVDAEGAEVADVRVSVADGLVARIEAAGERDLAQRAGEVEAAVRNRLSAWEDAIAAQGGAVAGPRAPLLNDYVDRVRGFGRRVQVVFPNGRVAAEGAFAGLDVWGRATIRLDGGRELEVAPEQASLRLAQQAARPSR